MSPETFENLLRLVGPLVTKAKTVMREPMNVGERLTLTIHYGPLDSRTKTRTRPDLRPITCDLTFGETDRGRPDSDEIEFDPTRIESIRLEWNRNFYVCVPALRIRNVYYLVFTT